MKHFGFALGLILAGTIAAAGQPFDLVLTGGHVIDPANDIDAVRDVAIRDGHIVTVGADLDTDGAASVVDVSGLYVVPGLIDLHAHLFHGTEDDAYLSNSYSALPPDGFTFRSGVTTAVDVGGPGWRNADQFEEQTIAHSRTRVLAFLNIVGRGMKGGPIEQNLHDMDPKMTALVAKRNADWVVGIKLAHYEGHEWTPTDRTIEAGRQAGLPVMVDFGSADPALPLEELLLEKFRPGDIYTHAYAHVRGRTPVVDETGTLRPYVMEAQRKGVIFDVGHGGGSFLFRQAVPATQQGLWPDAISTDLHTGSMNGGMKDLTNVMSKFLNLGMPLRDVVAATTVKPALVIDRPALGTLSVGSEADVAVLAVREGEFGLVDSGGNRMDADRLIEAELTLRAGQVVWDRNGIAAPHWNE